MRIKISLGLLATFFLITVSFVEAQQQAKLPKIGFLLVGPAASPGVELLRRELRALGYVEGKNIAFEYRSTGGKYERFPALADELVGLKVDVLLTPGTPACRATQANSGHQRPSRHPGRHSACIVAGEALRRPAPSLESKALRERRNRTGSFTTVPLVLGRSVGLDTLTGRRSHGEVPFTQDQIQAYSEPGFTGYEVLAERRRLRSDESRLPKGRV